MILFLCPSNTYGKVFVITNRIGVKYTRPVEVEVFESKYTLNSAPELT